MIGEMKEIVYVKVAGNKGSNKIDKGGKEGGYDRVYFIKKNNTLVNSG